jgi:hypothetical protein
MSTRSILATIPHVMGQLLDAAPLKIAVALVVTIGGWLTSPGLYQVAVWALILDWVTGTSKAMLLRQVHSDAGVRGAIKTTIYLALLGCGYAMTHAGPIASQAGEWVALLILYTEAVSNLENTDSITRRLGYDVPLLRRLIGLLRMRAEEIAPEEPADKPTDKPEKEETHAP